MSGNRERDQRTGRPRLGPFEAVALLSDQELEEELLTAAVAPDHRRFARFARLLRERDRRAREGEVVLVVVTGEPETRAEFAGELSRMLGATYLREQIDAIGGDSLSVANVADEVWGRARGQASGDL